MKYLWLILYLWLVLCLWASTSLGNSYSTGFPAGEMSSANWVQGGTTGINWSNVVNVPGFAFGTQTGAQHYDDSTAVLTGSWGSDQCAQATVAVPNPQPYTSEVELRLRTTISPGRITGYEFNGSVATNAVYMQIVRWNGALNDFTQIAGANTSLHAGDVIMAEAVGDQLTWYKNGNPVCSATDSTFSDGSPGIGMFSRDAAINADFGLANFSACDNGSSTPTPTPGPTPAPNPYAVWEGGLLNELRSVGVHNNQLNAVSAWLNANPPAP